MSAYEYVFLDLDGTISDSALGIVNAAVYALTAMEQPVPDRETLLQLVGPPLIDSFMGFFGFDKPAAQEAIRLFREYYKEKGVIENSMYDGMEELFKTLRKGGKKLVVATSKPETLARQILTNYEVTDYFEYIAGSVMDETRIRKSEVIAYAMETLGLKDPSKIVMVGDRRHDVEGAAALGIDCIGVLYGYGSREELLSAGAKYLANTPQGISKIILS